jgi:anti-sigma B factor antagonist
VVEQARVEIERTADALVVTVHGEVDISSIDRVGGAISEAFEHGEGRHVIDLTPTTFIDSVGIRLLFTLAAQLRMRRHQLHLVASQGSSVARVLTLMDVHEVIPTHGDLETALAADDEFVV